MAPRISGTVNKALDILDLFGTGRAAWTASDVARATGIHKSTVVRLCATLAARDYLRRDPDGYRLGVQVGALGQHYERGFDLEKLVRPVLQRLRDEAGESASYYVIDGQQRVCLYRENSRHAIRHQVDEGTRLPLDEGVVGRVLAAFAGRRGRGFDALRRDGFLDAEGREPLTASVAAPVLDARGALAGALVVSGPSNRFDPPARAATVERLLGACRALGRALPGAAPT